ncbi:histidine phosphatase family protein [Sciscionella sediminilitoris]|uniref:histidine phosphatase family protein n=1 Tax=Sciscionella sediminilitoris TaxID=1445613 RepID=UPI0004DF53EE|nr:histidine phosphatase family protein [Sciscionella sp. SE31]
MGVIYLVRHGQAAWGAEDYDVLSELGREQARLVGAELRRRGVAPQLTLSGTLRRQLDTAAEALPDLEARADQRWNEYDAAEIIRRYAGEDAVWPAPSQELLEQSLGHWGSETGPGTWYEFRQRIDDAMHELRGELGKGAAAVVFTSGGVISAVVASILGLDVRGFIALNRVTANASISKIVIGRSGANLLCFNDHAHFDGAGRELLTYR